MLALLVSFLFTNPLSPQKCDYIEMVQGEVYKEVHYYNSPNYCSYQGTYELELYGVAVKVIVSSMGTALPEVVEVLVLNNLPYTVEPSPKQMVEDDESYAVFYLVPMMF